MSKYVPDGNKQKAGTLPDNAYDRVVTPNFFTNHKTPNSVIQLSGSGVGYFFGSSASFAELDLNLTGTGNITCSNGTKEISGSGTAFTTELVSGDKIEITSASVSQVVVIDNIVNDVSMSVTENITLAVNGDESFSQSLVERKRTFMTENYVDYGNTNDGTELLIHPTAVSGSSSDDGNNIIFVYKSGLAGPTKRF